jgi:hypothetical protein
MANVVDNVPSSGGGIAATRLFVDNGDGTYSILQASQLYGWDGSARSKLLVDGSGNLKVTPGGTFTVTEATAATSVVTQVASSASSVTLKAANSSRLGFVITNDSTQILYVKFGTTASSSDYTLKMQPGTIYESAASPRYTGRIDGIWASANGNAYFTELTA